MPLGDFWGLVDAFCMLLGNSSGSNYSTFKSIVLVCQDRLLVLLNDSIKPTSCTNPEEKEYIDQQDYSIKLISPFNPTEKEYIAQQGYSIKQTSFTNLRDKGVYRPTCRAERGQAIALDD